MAALATPTPIEVAIADAIASVKPPKGVVFDRFFFDSDHTGDPAIRVVFTLRGRKPSDEARMEALTDFRIAVRDKLWDIETETGRIPYVRFEGPRRSS
jgi:hypothetical protein